MSHLTDQSKTLLEPIKYVANSLGLRRGRVHPKVFGIGMPKTGTTSLGAALRRLGYRHHSYDMELAAQVSVGEIEPAIHRAKSYGSFEDWPWFLIYQQLAAEFPDSKFILTTRASTSTWLSSLHRHRKNQGVYDDGFIKPPWWDLVFRNEPDKWDPSYWSEKYEVHNRSVQAHFRKSPGRLLTVCWENGDSWFEICRFLDRRVPKLPFPHANASEPAG